jgi:peptidoglycan/xylan/chitin deacetylase (PgdA/CDA1 family)
VQSRRVRLLQDQRARRRRRLAIVLVGAACVAGLVAGAGCRSTGATRETPRAQPTHVRRPPHGRARPRRPPQFVIASFDGSGGVRLWTYWRSIARRAHAHFTFFVSGVYLLDEARRILYHPPRHLPGRSDIGFAQPERNRSARAMVRGMLGQITAAYREGHEIGTHYNGHFCAPYSGNVGEWNAADWTRELDQFDKLLFRASANNDLRPRVRLPFGPDEIVGGRTPCLQGNLRVLYPVLARRGFRYDASQLSPLGDWPRRELGLWDVPLLEIPFVGHTFKVVSMDYSFFANQTGGVSGPPSAARGIELETYRSLWAAFRTSYLGKRAPLSIGNHFETWNHWAYDHALARFLLRACRLPEVRCASFRELVDWLDAQPPRLLRRYRSGLFPRETVQARINRG